MTDRPSNVKDRVQRYGLNLWAESGFRGTLEYATGVGKTRCGVLAAEYAARNYDGDIYIIAPTRTIRDRVWEKEFSKWGLSELYNTRVRTECIQTAYKWEGKKFGLVIVDEIHNTLTPEYFKFYQNNSYWALLGLSATIPEGKRSLLSQVAPTVHRVDVRLALQYGLVSPYRIYNIAVTLTDEERREYQKFCKVIDELQEKGIQAWSLIGKRRQILHNAANKLAITQEIASWFPNKYGLVFAQYKKDVEEIAFALGARAQYYHEGIQGKAEREIVRVFCDPTEPVNILVSAKRLNEGADFPYVSFAIIHAGTSSELVQTQQLGRIIRVEEGKQALLFRLYIAGTKDESWLRQSQFNVTKGASTEVTYSQSLTELKELLEDVV